MGELITLIEKDKRLGEDFELPSRLPYSGHLFYIPTNLYVIGTMNTADRSLALIDVALRRRFDFEEMPPLLDDLKKNPVKFKSNVGGCKELFEKSIEALKKLNNVLGNNPDIGKDKKIGHAFLCNIKNEEEIFSAWENKILPLLEEYYYFDKNELQKLSGEIYTASNGWDRNRINEFIDKLSNMQE